MFPFKTDGDMPKNKTLVARQQRFKQRQDGFSNKYNETLQSFKTNMQKLAQQSQILNNISHSLV